MSEEAWQRFLRHARRVLERPRFDEGQRDWKFKVATEVRAMLEHAGDPDRFVSALDATLPGPRVFDDPRLDLPTPRHVNWLRRWARLDGPGLGRGLGAFADGGSDPVERFAAFAGEADRAPAEARVSLAGTVAMGSLFNFSLASESLPILRPSLFARLEQVLGLDPKPGGSATEVYESQLDFANRIWERMEAEGLPIRDMIDVQSLIFIAAYEHDYWAVGEPEEVRVESERARASREGKPYLSICAMYQNEAAHLQEWIEFHRLVGVEHFYLYDNGSDDDHLEVLTPYIESGTVTLQDWPVYPGQMQANDHCMKEHRYDSRWIATLDIDEFLFSPTGASVPEVLVEYEQHPGVGVNWVVFGTAGHRTKPAGLVIENYLFRGREPWTWIKNVVDPTRVVRCVQAHAFAYVFQSAVDENHQPIHHDAGRTQFPSVSRLRINHYYLKSEVEGRAKLATPFEGNPRLFEFDDLDRLLSEERDEAIIRYLPALRGAMARTESEVHP